MRRLAPVGDKGNIANNVSISLLSLPGSASPARLVLTVKEAPKPLGAKADPHLTSNYCFFSHVTLLPLFTTLLFLRVLKSLSEDYDTEFDGP